MKIFLILLLVSPVLADMLEMLLTPKHKPHVRTHLDAPEFTDASDLSLSSWRTLLVYSWTFPDLAPKWIVTNESITAAGGRSRPCPPLLESVNRRLRGGKVGVFTHESGRGIGFMLDGTEQHALFHQHRRWTLARPNGTAIGNCTRSTNLVPERCEDDFADYSALLQFQCIMWAGMAMKGE